MRRIGHVPSKSHAERITAFLLTQDVAIRCDEANGQWEVWVRDEDQVERATAELESFLGEPEAPRYRAAVDEAQRIVREKKKKDLQVRHQQVHMTSGRWNAPLHRVAPLTLTLVAICVVVSLLTNLGQDRIGAAFRALSFTSLTVEQVAQISEGVEANPWDISLRTGSLWRGELWRAVTPIFIHFGVIHLIFNMYWLVHFGRQIEYRFGAWWLMAVVVAIAVPSNLAGMLVPEELDGIPIVPVGLHLTVQFGGMSGVCYGLFGFVWMKMLFDPRSGLHVAPSSAAILLIWLVMCMAPGFEGWFGFSPGNWAHGIGLAVGMAIGYWPKLLSDLGVGRPPNPET